MTSRRINEPSSSGVAFRSSTGWFYIDSPDGFERIPHMWGSSIRAAEWASAYFNKPWRELHALGFAIRGGAQEPDP